MWIGLRAVVRAISKTSVPFSLSQWNRIPLHSALFEDSYQRSMKDAQLRALRANRRAAAELLLSVGSDANLRDIVCTG